MAWLRIDDRFTEHRKVIALRRGDRWTWLEVLGYCARHGSGFVPANVADVLRYVTPTLVARLVEVGLLDVRADGAYEVHDWAIYNAATVEDRVRAHLQSDPDATANEVHRAIGGKREAVLRAHAAIVGDTTDPGSPGTDKRDSPGSLSGSPAGTRSVPSRARAVPTPTRPLERSPASHGTKGRPTPDDAGRAPGIGRLLAAGWTGTQTDVVLEQHDLERATAWLDHAEANPGTRNPGGLAWAGYASNVWPPDARLEVAPGAQGTRSTVPVHPHVCPHCPAASPTSFKTEHRLVEHLEAVHGDYAKRTNGQHATLADEPAIDVTATDA